MKRKMSFEERKELVLSNPKWDEDKKIVDRWYDIEEKAPDISTERLASMVADDFGWNYEDVIEIMGVFSVEMAKLKEEE